MATETGILTKTLPNKLTQNHRVDGKAGGIKKGEEILNHYCDIDLKVKDRREWAQGSLGM